ncbi:hypothetical protein EBESD8_6560 [Rhodococcus aetherivorans]|nr:hypothetical protein EBESD8_6560 [Rhodococcus aetherivorans]
MPVGPGPRSRTGYLAGSGFPDGRATRRAARDEVPGRPGHSVPRWAPECSGRWAQSAGDFGPFLRVLGPADGDRVEGALPVPPVCGRCPHRPARLRASMSTPVEQPVDQYLSTRSTTASAPAPVPSVRAQRPLPTPAAGPSPPRGRAPRLIADADATVQESARRRSTAPLRSGTNACAAVSSAEREDADPPSRGSRSELDAPPGRRWGRSQESWSWLMSRRY